jgi:hypothetical protein
MHRTPHQPARLQHETSLSHYPHVGLCEGDKLFAAWVCMHVRSKGTGLWTRLTCTYAPALFLAQISRPPYRYRGFGEVGLDDGGWDGMNEARGLKRGVRLEREAGTRITQTFKDGEGSTVKRLKMRNYSTPGEMRIQRHTMRRTIKLLLLTYRRSSADGSMHTCRRYRMVSRSRIGRWTVLSMVAADSFGVRRACGRQASTCMSACAGTNA